MTSSPDSRPTSAVDGPGIPPSFIQESLWLVDRMSPEDRPTYNEPLAFHVTGELRVAALRRALNRVVERHEALRTAFVETTEGLRAVVQQPYADFVEVADLRGLDTQTATARADALITDSYRRPFDLATGHLVRAIVVLLSEQESIVGLTVHHIATDGQSFTIILEEVHQDYTSLCRYDRAANLPEPTVRYAEYAVRLREDFDQGAFGAKIDYWKALLDDAPELLRLPLDRPRPPKQTFAGSSCSVSVPKKGIAGLLHLCRRECRTTDFTVLLAAYAVLLNRYTGQDAVAVGTTVLNRDSDDLLNVVGCFVNTAALVVSLREDMTFRELLAHTAAALRGMLNHGDAPYPKVLESLDLQLDPSHNPVFQTLLTLLGRRPVLDLGDGITCTPRPVRRAAAKFELVIYISESADTYDLEAEYNTVLFDAETIERMMRHYVHLLERLATDIDATVSSVAFLPDDERSRILDVWNDTGVDYPDSTVVDMFEAQAERSPDAIAVEFNGDSLTYGELDRLTNQVARFLMERRGAGSAPFIGVYMERSLEMVVALLAIVKAGCAYVPIDPEYPAERIAFMVEDAQLPLILTQERHRGDLCAGDAEIVVLSTAERRTEDTAHVQRRLTPDSPVYMIYTSGSTGRPKGVVNRHVSLFNRLYWMQSEYGLTADDRVLQKTPFSFDVSVWEFFWPLMFGARLVMARPGGHRDADYMKRVIQERRITTVHFIPSILNVFLEEEGLASFCNSLRRVICSGEALPYSAVERFYATLSCGLHNLYGPTEAAIDVSHWPCSLGYAGKVVPIGKPIANVRLYVLDKGTRLQPIGVPGELCIGGVALAAGYHRRDDLTGKAFIRDPFSADPCARLYRTGDLARFLPDGQIQYLGRIDNQIKLRGVRIEPEEVRAALVGLSNVKDATVVLHESGSNRMLVGYVVVSGGFDQQDIKERLRTRLPDFMVPQAVIEIPSIPTTPNGKLDRRALPDPMVHAQSAGRPAEPSSPEEEVLLELWGEILGVDRLGADASFFGQGGDSILSIKVAARLRQLGYAVEVHDIFARPSIRGLAEVMRSRRRWAAGPAETPLCLIEAADRERLPADVEDAWPLTVLQSGMIYHTMLHETTSVYHDIFDYEIVAEVHPHYLREAVGAVVAQHAQLRSVFDLDGFSRPLQIVRAGAPVPVEIDEVADLTRERQDEAIARWIEAEKGRAFDVERGPLVRVKVHVRSRGEMNLALSFHHAVLDGWSVALVLEEFRRTYADLLGQGHAEVRREALPFSAYVKLERQAMGDPRHAAFWSERLAGFTPSRLPRAASEDPAEPLAVPATLERVVPQPLAAALEAVARELGTPLKSVYLALHVKALGEVLQERRVVSGLVANGRPEVAGGDELVGLFLNTLPFPVELGEESWAELVRGVVELERGVVEHRRFPLAEIHRLTGTGGWFDVLFNYTDFHVYRESGDDGGVRIVSARYFEHTNFDAVVHVHRDHFCNRMRLTVNYDAARLRAELVSSYLDGYLAAIADLTSNAAGAPTRGGGGGEAPVTADAQPPLPARRISGVAPRTELEGRLTEIISQAIGVDGLGIDDNYLDLGVDSISAIRIVARIRRSSLGLTMKDLFAQSTVRGLARQAEAGQAGGDAPARPVEPFELAGRQARPFPAAVVDAYPATSMQLHMIRCTDQDVAQAAYHDVFSYRLGASLDEGLLRACLSQVMNGHDTLRTAFALEGYSVPMQLVYERVEPRLEIFDLSLLSDQQQDVTFEAWFELEKQTGFDWAQPGLIRFFAHRWSATHFTLTLSFHHSIIDGWSLSLLVRDLMRGYVAALNREDVPAPEAPALRYRDYVRVELESRQSQALRDFWCRRLEDHRLTALPRLGDNEHRVRWAETRVALDPALQQALSAVSTSLGVPLKYVMLAGHLRVLSLVCQESDVVTGVVTGGRLEQDEGDRVLGLFLNFMPCRQRVDDQTWGTLIRETFENQRASLPYRRYPLVCIEEALVRRPLFESLFNYTRFHAYGDIAQSPEGAGILRDIRWFEHAGTSLLTNVGYDVWQQRVIITLNANARILPQAAVETLGSVYEAILAQLVEHVDEAVAGLSGEVAGLMAALDDGGLVLGNAEESSR